MESNIWSSETDIIRLIDCLTSSEGNFPDVTIESIINQKNVKNILKNYLNKIVSISILRNEKELRDYYSSLTNRINSIEKRFKQKIPTMQAGYDYICGEKKYTGVFLKIHQIMNLLLTNAPNDTFEAIGWKNGAEFFMLCYDPLYLLALTRLYEKDEWHAKTYAFYRNLSREDFEEREINLINIDSKHINPTKAYMDRVPMWEDKIGGSIFVYNIEQEIYPMRYLSKYYHYIKEIAFHSDVIRHYSKDKMFSQKFMNYFLQSECKCVGFFEPHCLIEARCWQFSIEKLNILIEQFTNNEIQLENMNSVVVDTKYTIAISDNLIDLISNYSNIRQFPGNHRMFSMILKLNLFLLLNNQRDIDNYLVENADKMALWEGENESNIDSK